MFATGPTARSGVYPSQNWGASSSGAPPQVQRRGLRPDDRAPDGRNRHHLPRPRGEDEAVGGLPQPPRPRKPAGAVGQGRRPAREGTGRRARALPRIPAARDHPEARGDAGPDRPPLQAPRVASSRSAAADGGVAQPAEVSLAMPPERRSALPSGPFSLTRLG